VVDADILRSAGELGEHTSRPVRCSNFLTVLAASGHSVVITAEILGEWRRHRSRFGATWLRTMFARRRVAKVVAVDSGLAACADAAKLSNRRKAEVAKDAHLLGAALATDSVLTSLDEAARANVLTIIKAGHCKHLSAVTWVNPEKDSDAVSWLQDGAPSAAPFRLADLVSV
jgi:hypothetical protein